MSLKCFQCGGALSVDLEYCLNCRAAVHCCMNCVHRDEIVCRKVRGLLGPSNGVRVNDCDAWDPFGGPGTGGLLGRLSRPGPPPEPRFRT